MMSQFDILMTGYLFGLLVFSLNGMIFLANRRNSKDTIDRVKNMLYVHHKRTKGTRFRRK